MEGGRERADGRAGGGAGARPSNEEEKDRETPTAMPNLASWICGGLLFAVSTAVTSRAAIETSPAGTEPLPSGLQAFFLDGEGLVCLLTHPRALLFTRAVTGILGSRW